MTRRIPLSLLVLALAACADAPRTDPADPPCVGEECPGEGEGEGEAREGEGECECDCPEPAEGEGERPVGPPPAECDPAQTGCGEDEEAVYGVCVAGLLADQAGGAFAMGTDDRHHPEAGPLHDVTVSPFSLDRLEVSNALWAACVRCGTCTLPDEDGSFTGREPYYGNEEFDDHPVIYVSWEQAKAYCEGLGKRLPTEAEWELAARGTEDRRWPWGRETPGAQRANFGYLNGDTTPVGNHPTGATPEGVLDLAGNVWEWVADTWASGYGEEPVTDPQGPEAGPLKVVRGGSFGSWEEELRPWARTSYPATGTFANVGFRCAR